MSKRDKRPKKRRVGYSCKRKTRYRHEFDAKKAAKGYSIRAYFCSECNGWHLTSTELLQK